MNWFLKVTLVYIIAFVINWNINPCYPLEWFAMGYIMTLSIPFFIRIIRRNIVA